MTKESRVIEIKWAGFYSNQPYGFLKEHGYQVYPVNGKAELISDRLSILVGTKRESIGICVGVYAVSSGHDVQLSASDVQEIFELVKSMKAQKFILYTPSEISEEIPQSNFDSIVKILPMENFENGGKLFRSLEKDIAYASDMSVEAYNELKPSEKNEKYDQALKNLAAEFAKLLKNEIGEENLDKVVKQNKVNDPWICASHDYCDANMVMVTAFENIFGHEFHESEDEKVNDLEDILWNKSWTLAKKNDFDIYKILDAKVPSEYAAGGVVKDPEIPAIYYTEFKLPGNNRRLYTIFSTGLSANELRRAARIITPGMTIDEHRQKAIEAKQKYTEYQNKYNDLVDNEFMRIFGRKRHASDYKVSGVFRDEFSEEVKNQLRSLLTKMNTYDDIFGFHNVNQPSAKRFDQGGVVDISDAKEFNTQYDGPGKGFISIWDTGEIDGKEYPVAYVVVSDLRNSNFTIISGILIGNKMQDQTQASEEIFHNENDALQVAKLMAMDENYGTEEFARGGSVNSNIIRIQPYNYHGLFNYKPQRVWVDLDYKHPDPSKSMIWGYGEIDDTVSDFKNYFEKAGPVITLEMQSRKYQTANQQKARRAEMIREYIGSISQSAAESNQYKRGGLTGDQKDMLLYAGIFVSMYQQEFSHNQSGREYGTRIIARLKKDPTDIDAISQLIMILRNYANTDSYASLDDEMKKIYNQKVMPGLDKMHEQAKNKFEQGGYISENNLTENINIYGYQTQNFDISPNVVDGFRHTMTQIDLDREEESAYYHSMQAHMVDFAKQVDAVLALEKKAIHHGEQLTEDDFAQLIDLMGKAAIHNHKCGDHFDLTSHLGPHFNRINGLRNNPSAYTEVDWSKNAATMAEGGELVKYEPADTITIVSEKIPSVVQDWNETPALKKLYGMIQNVVNTTGEIVEVKPASAVVKFGVQTLELPFQLISKVNFRKGGTIEDDTPIMPDLIAEEVAMDAFIHDGRIPSPSEWQEISGKIEKLTNYLVEKADKSYKESAFFRKKMNARGNAGRDALYAYMRNWVNSGEHNIKHVNGGEISNDTLDSYLQRIKLPKITSLGINQQETDFIRMMDAINKNELLEKSFKNIVIKCVDGFLSRSFAIDFMMQKLYKEIASKPLFWDQLRKDYKLSLDPKNVPEKYQQWAAKLLLSGIYGEFEIDNRNWNKYLPDNLKQEIETAAEARGREKFASIIERTKYEKNAYEFGGPVDLIHGDPSYPNDFRFLIENPLFEQGGITGTEPYQVIYQQIGKQALYMLGANNFLYSSEDPTWLSFRIKGSKKVNYIKIKLENDDTYTLTFSKIRKVDPLKALSMNQEQYYAAANKIVAEVKGVYFDDLHDIIESRTGLYTRLFAKGGKVTDKEFDEAKQYLLEILNRYKLEDKDKKALTDERIKKILSAGYTKKEAAEIFFGYASVNGILSDNGISGDYYPGGFYSLYDEYRDRFIEWHVDAANKNEFELGLKYPGNINWKPIIKKYKIDITPKIIVMPDKHDGSAVYRQQYQIFKGENVVIGAIYKRERYREGDPGGSYTEFEPLIEDGKFENGYWGIVSHDKKVIQDIAKMITSQKDGYVDNLEIYLNRLGGLGANNLNLINFQYEHGGSVKQPWPAPKYDRNSVVTFTDAAKLKYGMPVNPDLGYLIMDGIFDQLQNKWMYPVASKSLIGGSQWIYEEYLLPHTTIDDEVRGMIGDSKWDLLTPKEKRELIDEFSVSKFSKGGQAKNKPMKPLKWIEKNAQKLIEHYLGAEYAESGYEGFSDSDLQNPGDYIIDKISSKEVSLIVYFGEHFENADKQMREDYKKYASFATELASKNYLKLSIDTISNPDLKQVAFNVDEPDFRREKGGQVRFDDKVRAISGNLQGKKVPRKYENQYGKRYSKPEAVEAARRIAGSIEQKMNKKRRPTAKSK